jgi:hypothetical protein
VRRRVLGTVVRRRQYHGRVWRRRARVGSGRATRSRAGGGGRRRKDLELEGFVEVGSGPEEGPRGRLLARLLQLRLLRALHRR